MSAIAARLLSTFCEKASTLAFATTDLHTLMCISTPTVINA